ncbi:unnamed protein product [Lupinus luteus]|uniref:Uncharacterized protein n=1 Tax=Lupinus luteus TaxID=3873 RepID=A0AAV1YHR8_LUPLU
MPSALVPSSMLQVALTLLHQPLLLYRLVMVDVVEKLHHNLCVVTYVVQCRGMFRYFSFYTWDRRSFVVHLWSLDLFTLMVKELVHAMMLSLADESGKDKLKPPQGKLSNHIKLSVPFSLLYFLHGFSVSTIIHMK